MPVKERYLPPSASTSARTSKDTFQSTVTEMTSVSLELTRPRVSTSSLGVSPIEEPVSGFQFHAREEATREDLRIDVQLPTLIHMQLPPLSLSLPKRPLPNEYEKDSINVFMFEKLNS